MLPFGGLFSENAVQIESLSSECGLGLAEARQRGPRTAEAFKDQEGRNPNDDYIGLSMAKLYVLVKRPYFRDMVSQDSFCLQDYEKYIS